LKFDATIKMISERTEIVIKKQCKKAGPELPTESSREVQGVSK
jgi:hypothetical protein